MCISTPRYSILINGQPCIFLQGGCALRKGDPMSPFQFIIMTDTLSKMIATMVRSKTSNGTKAFDSLSPFSHHLFVDDALLYGKLSLDEAMVIKYFLTNYCEISRQYINKDKPRIYFFNIGKTAQRRIETTLGIGSNNYHIPIWESYYLTIF